MTEKLAGREVIFEFHPVGHIMRVSVMDVATLTEVVIQCPVTAGEAAFKRNGILRLEYVLRKNGIIK